MLSAHLKNILCGSDALILGSAPRNTPTIALKDNTIYCYCNLSSLGSGIDRIPDITFIGSYTALTEGTKNSEHFDRLNLVKTKHLFVIGGAGDIDTSMSIINEKCTFDTIESTTLNEKYDFLNKYAGDIMSPDSWTGVTGQKVPSTGMMSILLLLFSGVNHLECAGFSRKSGHSYLDSNLPRNHLHIDSRLLEWILDQRFSISIPPEILEHDS